MSKLALEHKAINLSQGFPGFDCSPQLVDLVEKYMRKGLNQYAPMPGVQVLREAISTKTEELYSITYDPETEITITSGATQALFTAIAANVLTKISIETGSMGVDSLAMFPFCIIPAFAPPTILLLHWAIFQKMKQKMT
jgi:DNA-binding transcriptional MocR family regulator